MIVQENVRGDNRVRLRETSVQRNLERSSTPTSRQDQRTQQTARVSQKSTSGANEITLTQSVVQSAISVTSRVKTQMQNVGSGSSAPATLTEIAQTSESGPNLLQLDQSHTLSASARHSSITQTQGSTAGGIVASVNQTTRGISQATVMQTERFDLAGGSGAKQRQYGPIRCCSRQQGARGTRMDLVQTSVLTATGSKPTQATVVSGACNSTGVCAIDHVASLKDADTRRRTACNDRNCTTTLRRG
jgi:hypothetical protein